MEYGNQHKCTKSFYDWCMENDRMDLNDRFDELLNNCTTKDVAYTSNKKYYFKCPRNIHDSELYIMSFITKHVDKEVLCRHCGSLAQVVMDNFGEDYLNKHWSKDNEISPWDIWAHSVRGNLKVKIQCDKKDYHVYEQVPRSFAKGIGCPYCINRKVHHLDSLGAVYSEVIDRWSSKNDKTPFDYSPHSSMKVWLKCPCGKHNDYLQQISNAVIYNFTCRECENEKVGLAKRGKNSRFWKGGISKKNDVLRRRFEYTSWRTSIYQRDNYVCQCCGKTGKLNAHHILSFSDYEDLRYDIKNGITLCEECHDSTKAGSFHNIYGTHNNTKEQLREYILNKSSVDIYITHPQILSLDSTKLLGQKEATNNG